MGATGLARPPPCLRAPPPAPAVRRPGRAPVRERAGSAGARFAAAPEATVRVEMKVRVGVRGEWEMECRCQWGGEGDVERGGYPARRGLALDGSGHGPPCACGPPPLRLSAARKVREGWGWVGCCTRAGE